MNILTHFKKGISRTLFVVIIFFALFGQKMYSPKPGVFLSAIKNISVPIWILLIILYLAGFWLILNLKNANSEEEQGRKQKTGLSVEEAVMEKNGGNGLASAPFDPKLPFFNLAGWINIKEFGKEAIVIDGQTTIKKTQLLFAPMRLIGRPLNARRVLLSPPPLIDINASASTKDRWDLTLVVSIKYLVLDPAYVASLSGPLAELTNKITGTLIEQIHSSNLDEIVIDDGSLRQAIKDKLNASITLKDNYYVEEILKALPTGDERIIEIIRQTREALQKAALVDQEGQNKLRAAGYDLEIKKGNALLDEEIKQRDFIRERELLKMQSEFQVMQETMRSVAQIAASGMNASSALKEIRGLFLDQQKGVIQALPPAPKEEEFPLIETERKLLESISDKFSVQQIELVPDSKNESRPGKGVITLEGYTIYLDCSENYPIEPPKVQIKKDGLSKTDLVIAWYSGSNLSDAVTSAILQARLIKSKK